MAKKTIKMTEQELNGLVKEAMNELDWKTYASAARKAKLFRDEHPNVYDRNRGSKFDMAAIDAFNKKYGLEGQYDKEGIHSRKGTINLHSNNGEVELSGSRNHNFGDGDPHRLGHNVYHMSKKYGKDGKYGRTRMWDHSHETTPEEFYGDENMGNLFRQAEKEVDDFNNGKSKYIKGKGWTSEQKISTIVSQVLKEANDYWNDAVDNHLTQERLPKGWRKEVSDNGTIIYTDPDLNQYVKDEYGKLRVYKSPFNEQKIHSIVSNAIRRITESNELYDEWYQEEDYNGNIGKPGDHKSYELGHMYVDQAVEDAKESGYNNLEDYLWFWLDEVVQDIPWYWSNDNAYKGERLFTHDGFTFYELYGQLILDEYPIADARRNQDFDEKLRRGEYWTK